jgi:hypothetical protein
MKTAMQELIELVEKGETRLDLIENHKQIWLEKEKGQIIEGVEFGLFNADTTIDGEEYYNQKYLTKTNNLCI